MTFFGYDGFIVNKTSENDNDEPKGEKTMKKRKQLFVVGLIVAALTVASVSVYAAEATEGNQGGIIQEFGQKVFGGGRGQGGPGQGRGGQRFDKAIESGILTEAEADAIEAYHEENRPDMEVLKEELEGLTKDEIKAYMEENYPRPEDPHAELVEAGLLTQEQADALDALRAEFEANRPEGSERGQGGVGGQGRPNDGEEQPSI